MRISHTAIGMYLGLCEDGMVADARDIWLDAVPAWQIAARFADFAPHCPDRIDLGVERRPGNALNIEIGTPLPRCKQLPPNALGSYRWLASGGSALAIGCCGAAECPRAKGCAA